MEGDSVKVPAGPEGQKWGLGEDRQRTEEGGGKGVKRWTKGKEEAGSWSIEREKDSRSQGGSLGYILYQQLA